MAFGERDAPQWCRRPTLGDDENERVDGNTATEKAQIELPSFNVTGFGLISWHIVFGQRAVESIVGSQLKHLFAPVSAHDRSCGSFSHWSREAQLPNQVQFNLSLCMKDAGHRCRSSFLCGAAFHRFSQRVLQGQTVKIDNLRQSVFEGRSSNSISLARNKGNLYRLRDPLFVSEVL